ncbi:hypothetical protein FA15DRAFT_710193 [Coprinopsis marcescibilis]|uniref:Uncharacterized protein n=1 Tax=Coprinopsis marcescibilis TaxID=230819 RepID=A0A5C3KDE1_COPMA|nr:hypothetical protein FA15DRAFT_710193 [Coprinopsis marcescibilis]
MHRLVSSLTFVVAVAWAVIVMEGLRVQGAQASHIGCRFDPLPSYTLRSLARFRCS